MWQFSGDAATVGRQIRQALLHIQGTELDFSTVLKSVSESIPPHSIVYVLSMSVCEVPEYISILEEQDCTCFWLYAPRENFPPKEPDKPRFVNRKKIRDSLAGLPCIPEIADFTTGAEILESRSLYEKI